MPEREKKTLKMIQAPKFGPVLDAPPVLIFSTHTVHYSCGYCGQVLMHADDGQVRSLQIRCNKCGSYNKTE